MLERYRQGDADAANNIARKILNHVHGAMKHFGIMENAPPQEWKDFRDETAKHIWASRLDKYDPEKSQFNTFVFNHVNNMWKNWLKRKSTKPLDEGPSLDEPIGDEEGQTMGDVSQDPLALDFKSEVEAQLIESALLENIQNPRHKEILNLWLSEDPKMGVKARSAEVAEKYNKAHPDKTPIKSYRMYRIMTDEIYPLILDKFPEFAGNYGFMPNVVQDDQSKRWVKKPGPEEAPAPTLAPIEEEDEEDEEDEEYVPLGDKPAPVYRINPQTGERTQISLNMKRRLTAAQEARCHNLMAFLSIERYGKSRRTIKSSTTQ